MVGYNLTQINASSYLQFSQGVNEVLVGGWLGILILIGFFVVMLMSLIFVTNDVRKALMTSSFIGFAMALSLRAVSLITNDLALFITLIILATITALTFKNS